MSLLTDAITGFNTKLDNTITSINGVNSTINTRANAVATNAIAAKASEDAAKAFEATALASKNTVVATQTAINHKYRGALAANPATRTDGTANQAGDYYVSSSSVPSGLTLTFNGGTWQASDISTANLASSGGAGLLGWIRSAASAVATTLSNWLNWQAPSIFDYMTAAEVADVLSGALTIDVTAKIQLALDGASALKAKTVTMRGNALFTNISIPIGVTLKGDGNRAAFQLGGEGTPSSLVRTATATGVGVTLAGQRSRLENIGVFAKAGSAGDGVWVAANYCSVVNVASNGHNGAGIRVGATAAGYKNCNGWYLSEITAAFNTGDGVVVDDLFSTFPLNDSNAGTFSHGDMRSNGGDGLKVGSCFGNTFVGVLTEVNSGYGARFTNKSFKNTFIGGDQDEGNTLGVVRNEGQYNQFYGVLSSGFSDVGSFTNLLGYTTNSLVGTKFTGLVDLGLAGQIKFPTAVNASTDPNTLDDYKEGTFTPTIAGTTAAGEGTYTAQVGHYTKIGRKVFFNLNLAWTGLTGATGILVINGLPFLARNTAGNNVAHTTIADSLAVTAGNSVQSFTFPVNSQIALRQYPPGGAAAAIGLLTSGTLMISGSIDT